MAVVEQEPLRHSQAFNRVCGGLVDPSDYEPYLVDIPADTPTKLDTKSRDPKRFVHQHEYFKEREYHQTHLPGPDRDRRLKVLREAPYSQIVMRNPKEDELHLDKEETVSTPPIEVVEGALIGYFDIDIVGAATFGLQEMRNPKPQPPPEWYRPLPELIKLSPTDKIRIFKQARQASLERLNDTTQLPELVAASALKRIAVHIRSNELNAEADNMLDRDWFFYPLKVPKEGYLRTVANLLLQAGVGAKSIEEARVEAQALEYPIGNLKAVA